MFDSREFKKRMEQKDWESKHTKTGSTWLGFLLETEFDHVLADRGLESQDLEAAIM